MTMGADSTFNRQTTAVPEGGASAQPTPANNVGGGEGWGDRLWLGGKHGGSGHAEATNPRSTMGDFLALDDQKTRGQSKFVQRQNLVDNNVAPMNAQGEPTCATEDHSFMRRKAGDPDTYPGWGAFKSFFGM
ncbi:hypothetical protein N7489_007627 [Penicillium chrysogenum]|uniref:Conidiation-specific protein n=1 Tax=Penicillium chrysogenum TaxID=5076 RepID=A0ABQ8W717_PENCH|nr:uncharacterized protein N7489_007627 [Penicillium chrysogenum]KAJ5237536.1 hypothetical protein N7489_007627 [Penicillium chrysogenum]KAJ5256474.1 hypothetical protein N7505_011625 [Penicillium chrysogenum]KAJ5277687.1 hypothetical protein N7524_003840 [Penicillium chrysogenum]KAJ6160132.1 hypothetical protein N7497_004669 [Penicillium chrysogenum]